MHFLWTTEISLHNSKLQRFRQWPHVFSNVL